MEPVTIYHQIVEAFVQLTGSSRSLLHLHIGMVIYLGCQLLLGARRGTLVAVIFTLLLALAHEGMNRMFHGSWRWVDTGQDVAVSLFWPVMCYTVGRMRQRRRMWMAGRPASVTPHGGRRPAGRPAAV